MWLLNSLLTSLIRTATADFVSKGTPKTSQRQKRTQSSNGNKAGRGDPHMVESLGKGLEHGTDASTNNRGRNTGQLGQGDVVMLHQKSDKWTGHVGRQTHGDHGTGNVVAELAHGAVEQGVVDGQTDGPTQRADANDETRGDGNEFRRRRQLRQRDERHQRQAQTGTQEYGEAPRRPVGHIRGVRVGHERKEDDKAQERRHGEPAHLLGEGQVQTAEERRGDGHDRGDAVARADEHRVRLVQHAGLEGKVAVGAKEGQALAEQTGQRDGEVAVLEDCGKLVYYTPSYSST